MERSRIEILKYHTTIALFAVMHNSEIDSKSQLKSDGVITKKMRDLAIEIIRNKILVLCAQTNIAT